MLSLVSPSSSAPATTTTLTDSPIALCLRALNLHTTTHQPINKEAEKVEAAIRVALSDQSTTPEAIAIILKNAFVHHYVPALNNMILQIKDQDTAQTIPITDKVIEILRDDNIALTVGKDGQIEMSEHTSIFPSDLWRDSWVTSKLESIFPEDVIGIICKEDYQHAFPKGFVVDSAGKIQFDKSRKELEMVLTNDAYHLPAIKDLKREIIKQVIEQGKQKFLNELFREINNKNTHKRGEMAIGLNDVNLRGFDLRGINFFGVNFSGANLTKSNLRGVNLELGCLVGADLSEADLSYTNLTNSNFGKAKLVKADLRYAKGGECTKFHQANLMGADLRHVQILHALFSAADLTKANLSGAIFMGAQMRKVNLSGAKLHGTNLSSAYLDEAIMNEVEAERTIFNGANMKKVLLREARLFYTVMNRDKGPQGMKVPTNLTGADMAGVISEGITFKGAILIQVNFTDATLFKAKFDDANLDGALFHQTNLREASVTKASSFKGMSVDDGTMSTLSFASQIYIKEWLKTPITPSPKVPAPEIVSPTVTGDKFHIQ